MSNVSLIDGHIEKVKTCENCAYYDMDRNDMPCACCMGYSNWEESEEKDNA